MADPTIDPATLDALKDMAGAEFVDELVGTFLEEAPQMIADLHAAKAAGEVDRFRRAAHSLKSNSMTFGALTLGGLAKALELGGLAAASDAALASVDAEYARVVDALKGMTRG